MITWCKVRPNLIFHPLDCDDELLTVVRHPRRNPLDSQRILALRSAVERFRNGRISATVDAAAGHGTSVVCFPVAGIFPQDRRFEDGRIELGHAVPQHKDAIIQLIASMIPAAFVFAPGQAL